jgi:hypothetical protein
MADTITTNYSFVQPEIGGSTDTWGTKLNANWLAVDTALKAVSDKADANETDVAANTAAIAALDFSATAISYDPSAVSLTATTAQGALDQLCTLPTATKSANYILAATDVGGLVRADTGVSTVTVPASVFSLGDVIVVHNATSGDISIVQGSGVTLHWVNPTTGTRTLGQRGVATLLCVDAGTTFVVTGQGLS